MKRSHILILAAGDLLALLAFVWLGQMDHQTLNTSNPLLGALPTAAPLAGAWLIAAWLMNAYPGTVLCRGCRSGWAAPRWLRSWPRPLG